MRVALLEDEPFFRQVLARALAAEPEVEVVADFADPAALVAAVPTLDLDAVVVDLVLQPGQSPRARTGGLAAGRQVRRISPGCGVVILSNHADPGVLVELTPAELRGWAYLLKRTTDDLATLVRGLQVVSAGGTMIDPSIIAAGRDPLVPGLSPHEHRVLIMLAGGASNGSIAAALGVSTKSVEHSITAILQAMGIDGANRTENPRVVAALAYLRMRAPAP